MDFENIVEKISRRYPKFFWLGSSFSWGLYKINLNGFSQKCVIWLKLIIALIITSS